MIIKSQEALAADSSRSQRPAWRPHWARIGFISFAALSLALLAGACKEEPPRNDDDDDDGTSASTTTTAAGGAGGVGGAGPTAAGGNGTGGDGGDGGDGGSPCVPETEAVFCQNQGSECGSTTGTNQCGDDWTVDCGSCASPEMCGANAQANQCGVDGWDINTVDATGDVGHAISMALDASGEPYIAYRRDDITQLRVASRQGGTWTLETLDTGVFAGTHTAIAFDPNGVAHVVATSFEGLNIWRQDGGVWVKENINGLSRGRVGLAFDAGGDPHICVHVESVETLQYWTRTGTQPWQSQNVDGGSPGSAVGDYCSIGVGSDGGVHISYHEQQFFRLRYAFKPANGVWSSEVVDEPSGDLAGEYTALSLDAMNNPFVAYRSGSINYQEIRLVDHVGVNWNSQVADNDAGSIANYTSLALAPNGTPHLSYYSTSLGGQIRYNTNPGNGWAAQVLETVGTSSGGYNAIAVGAGSNVHIAFYNATMQALRYATTL